jgi:tRNA dimethylallyltransferase
VNDASVVAIFGPTGVGKTAVALALGDLVRAAGREPVAVSADALQVYAGVEPLTGAPSAAERARLEHRLVGTVDAARTFSVGEYMPLAHAEIDAALAAGRRPIVVGGTGLYLRAALCDLELGGRPPHDLRDELEAELAARGPAALHAELAARAPDIASGIEPQDGRRVVRALELLTLGHEDAEEGRESQLWSAEMRHPTLLAGLTMAREQLYARIDGRVDAMVAAGAAEAVRRVEARGASRTARGALGYAELLAGDIQGMKRRTRRYAKRQLTWMRKMAGVETVDMTDRSPTDAARAIAARAGWPAADR